MTEVITDDRLLHPAFFVSGESSKCSVIFSSDGASVLACSQPVARVGEGSVKFAELFKEQILRILRQPLLVGGEYHGAFTRLSTCEECRMYGCRS